MIRLFKNRSFFGNFRFPSDSYRKADYLLLIACCLLLIVSSCKEKKKVPAAISVKKDVYYTCSMHPQVHEDHPGNCPICGMKLIAVAKTGKTAGKSMTVQISLSPEQILLGNIKTDTVDKGSFDDQLVLTGSLNFNQDDLSSVNARVEGRIDKLYFKNIGDYEERR